MCSVSFLYRTPPLNTFFDESSMKPYLLALFKYMYLNKGADQVVSSTMNQARWSLVCIEGFSLSCWAMHRHFP